MHLCPWPHCNRRTINSMIMIMMMMMMMMVMIHHDRPLTTTTTNQRHNASCTVPLMSKSQKYKLTDYDNMSLRNSACIMCLHLWNLESAHHWQRQMVTVEDKTRLINRLSCQRLTVPRDSCYNETPPLTAVTGTCYRRGAHTASRHQLLN